MIKNKEEQIKKIFSSIAPRYDLANSLLTFGLDQLWRKKLVKLSEPQPDHFILDCASGTGKLAFKFLEKLEDKGKVIGVDFCENMLSQIKFKDPRLRFEKANMLELPFPDQKFHITSVAYGLRNLSDLEKGLKEMARVTKNKGCLMALETGKPTNKFLRPFIQIYFNKIMPSLGGWITGDKSAYDYLNQSSENFPSGPDMIEIFKSTDCFSKISFYPLLGGVSFIYKAIVKH